MISVSTCKLDDALDDTCDVMKIDVEGAENEVMGGAVGTIRKDRPVILMDLHPQLGADVEEIHRIFARESYIPFDMMDLKAPLRRLPITPIDVLFCPEERLPQRRSPPAQG